MNQLLEEFFNRDKVLERTKRDEVLIECGLYTEEKQYSDKSGWGYKFDYETRQYFKVVKVPIELTDEEYGRVLQIYRKNKAVEDKKEKKDKPVHMETVNPHAERILNFFVVLFLVFFIIVSSVILIAGIAMNTTDEAPLPLIIGVLLAFIVLVYGFVLWALQKVLLNMSNNLHNISRLVERIEKSI